MKLQSLAIIFVIIILPITIVVGEYAATQIETFRLEQLYDSRLITATHDALKAFQINTFNDATSDIADSKINSIEASANAFYNSMESSFGLQGYSKEELKSYVPALVYTMYDGYYIYSPYSNIAEITEDAVTGNSGLDINLDTTNIEYGFKPYVYYSCRYVRGDIDVIINYSLDNYITVQGTIGGVGYYKSGYLVTLASSKTDEGLYKETLLDGTVKYYYSGQQILPEANLDTYTTEDLNNYLISSQTDMLVEIDATGTPVQKAYKYLKLNGTKYYWDETNEYIFYLLGGSRIKQVTKASDEATYNTYVEQVKINTSGISYYESAYNFTTWINSNLGDLEPTDAVTSVQNSGTGKIFENDKIEYTGSNFNLHRKEVIRYSIESNLSIAIANFNSYTDSGANFQMPKLKETEWELLENEVSIISFLQGLNIGGKLYNGYTVVTNSKTEEVVKEERIYITTNDTYYHKINDTHFVSDYDETDVLSGVLDLDFEIRKDGATGLSYMHRQQFGCYTSIVGQGNVDTTYDSIYEYLEETSLEDEIKQIYYIALGRERWGTYKIENPQMINGIISEMNPVDPDAGGEVDPEDIPELIINIDPNPEWIYPNAYITYMQNPTLKAIISVSCADGIDNAQFVFSNEITAPATGWQTLDMSADGLSAGKEVSTVITSPGTYYLYVRASSGIVEKIQSHRYDIYQDNNPPTITIENTDGVEDGQYTIESGYANVIIQKTITAVDEGTAEGDMISGIKAGSGTYNITDPDGNTYNLTDADGNILDNTNITFTETNPLIIGIAADKEGIWTLTVSIQDNAGNTTTKTVQYEVTNAPVVLPTYSIQITNTDGNTTGMYQSSLSSSHTFKKKLSLVSSTGVVPAYTIKYAFVIDGSAVLYQTYSTSTGISRTVTVGDINPITYRLYIQVFDSTTGELLVEDSSKTYKFYKKADVVIPVVPGINNTVIM